MGWDCTVERCMTLAMHYKVAKIMTKGGHKNEIISDTLARLLDIYGIPELMADVNLFMKKMK